MAYSTRFEAPLLAKRLIPSSGLVTPIEACVGVEGQSGDRATENIYLSDAHWARIAPFTPTSRGNGKCPRDRCWKVGCS